MAENIVPTDRSTRRPKRRVLRYVLVGLAVVAVTSFVALKVAQYFSDGPLTAIVAGGPLRSGTLVTEANVDWPAVIGEQGDCVGDTCTSMEPIEFQLVDPPTSRFVGIMVHDGELYIPCDLGYMWARFSGTERRVLHLIYIFKRWHEDAVEDGRAVLRIDGKRYLRQAVLVTDPELIADLEHQLEETARQWVAPDPLPEAPTEEPNDIWFFRMDPRPAT